MEDETNYTKIPFRLQQIIPDLKLYASVMEGLLHFYVYTDSTVVKQISAFFRTAYILLGMFQGNSSVMPNQLYHDVQSTLIDAVFCAAKASVYFPTEPLYLVQDGSDPLERTFGHGRMVLANQSDDSLSLINSFSTIELCDKILTNGHQEWSRKSRVSSRIALDYSSPASWDAEKLKIGDEDVALHWNIGRLQGLADVFKHKGREVKETINGTSVTLKRPKGKLIGLNETRLESVTPMDETNVNDDVQQQSAGLFIYIIPQEHVSEFFEIFT